MKNPILLHQGASPAIRSHRDEAALSAALDATAASVRRPVVTAPAMVHQHSRPRRLLVPAIGALVAGMVAAGSVGAHAPAAAVADQGSDGVLFGLVNQDRTSNGVGSLQYYQSLGDIGEAGNYGGCGFNVHGRAQDMIERNYFAHPILNCGGQNVFPMMTAYGIPYSAAGENIGWNNNADQMGSVAAIDSSFMNSPEHRANILNPSYTHMGVGSANSGGATWNGGSGPGYQNVAMYSEEFAQLPGGTPGTPPPGPPLPAGDTSPVVNGAAAVVGVDRQPYAFTGTYQPLGGRTLATPAVVKAPGGVTLYIVIGDDHALWVSSGDSNWRHLSSEPTWCQFSPAAAVVGARLEIGCVGADSALWAAYADVPAAGGIPTVANFASLGGVLTSGPGVAVVAGSPTFVVDGVGGGVWFRSTAAAGWASTGWRCIDHPALANLGGTAYFGCQGADGALWTSHTTDTGWAPPSSSGGRLLGGVGVAPPVGASGARFFVEGVRGDVWQANVQLNGTTWYDPRGGQVLSGAAASGY